MLRIGVVVRRRILLRIGVVVRRRILLRIGVLVHRIGSMSNDSSLVRRMPPHWSAAGAVVVSCVRDA